MVADQTEEKDGRTGDRARWVEKVNESREVLRDNHIKNEQ